MASKYLINARNAREEKNSEDGKKFYDMVRTEEPDNGEAKFFYLYYSLYEGKNAEIGNRFGNICKAIEGSIKLVANSSDSPSEKMAVLTAIVDAFIPLTWDLNRFMNKLTVGSGSNARRVFPASHITDVSKIGMKYLYLLGDYIFNYFGENNETIELALKCWKEAITLNRKWYAWKLPQTPEEYAEKIKKYDSSYEMPKKAGCITFTDKK